MLLVRLHINYLNLLKLKAYKLFEIVMLTSPGFFFKEANLYYNKTYRLPYRATGMKVTPPAQLYKMSCALRKVGLMCL